MTFLESKQQYIIQKVTNIMKSHPSIRYEIKFRNGKMKTAGTILEDERTHFKTFVFSNY
jgi:hypothetical protein